MRPPASPRLSVRSHLACETRRLVHRDRRQAGQFEGLLVVVLPGEHRLEDRLIRKASRRPHDLHHMLERQVLVRIRVEHAVRPELGKSILETLAHR